MNLWIYTGVIGMTILGSVAALFLKKASGAESIIGLLTNINLYIGASLYVGTAIINIYLLKYLDYSIVIPFTALTYLWTAVISYFIYKDKINKRKITGILLVIVGVVLLVQS